MLTLWGGAAFTPASIPSLALWLDGRAPTYSDSGGTTPATAPAGRVYRSNEPAPLSGHWSSDANADRPFRETNALDFQDGQLYGVLSQGTATLPTDDATLGVAFVLRDGRASGYEPLILADDGGSGGNAGWGVAVYVAEIIVFRNGANDAAHWSTGITVPDLTRCAAVVRFKGAAGCDIKVTVGGTTYTASDATACAARTATAFDVGRMVIAGGATLHGVVSQAVGVGRAVTAAERDGLLAFLATYPAPAAYPTDAPLVIVAGDSIARGFPVLRPYSWAFKMLPNLYATGAVRLRNTAVPSYSVPAMAADYASLVLPLYSAARTHNILIPAVGTNDMSTVGPGGGLSGAATLAAYWAYCDQAKADGLEVVACTVLPRDATNGGGAAFDAARATFNTGVRSGWSLRCSGLADVARDPVMGPDGAAADTTYYPDLLHPSVAGHALMEPYYRRGVKFTLAPLTGLTGLVRAWDAAPHWLHQDAAGTIAVAAGDFVGKRAERFAGVGGGQTQATSNRRMTYRANPDRLKAENGFSWLVYDSPVTYSGPFSLYFVLDGPGADGAYPAAHTTGESRIVLAAGSVFVAGADGTQVSGSLAVPDGTKLVRVYRTATNHVFAATTGVADVDLGALPGDFVFDCVGARPAAFGPSATTVGFIADLQFAADAVAGGQDATARDWIDMAYGVTL